MIKLVQAYFRGFIGGPDFSRCIAHNYILDDKQLSFNIPNSNVVAAETPADINIPHKSSTWFEQNKKSFEQHEFVRFFTENWMYLPPISITPSSEYGMLSCQFRIKKTNKVDVLNKTNLASFVTEAYHEFHNGIDGVNTEIRQTAIEQSSKMAMPFEAEELENQINLIINNRGKPTIPAAVIKKINETDWIFYQELRSNVFSRSDFYCLPLSETCFLEVEFRHRVDLNHKHKKWKKHALASQERIMASITLADIPVEQDNLLTENTTKTATTANA